MAEINNQNQLLEAKLAEIELENASHINKVEFQSKCLMEKSSEDIFLFFFVKQFFDDLRTNNVCFQKLSFIKRVVFFYPKKYFKLPLKIKKTDEN